MHIYMFTKRQKYKIAHRSTVHNDHKLETTQMTTSSRIDNKCLMYLQKKKKKKKKHKLERHLQATIWTGLTNITLNKAYKHKKLLITEGLWRKGNPPALLVGM